ncbi:hypothetical protein CKF43_06560 [Pantoea graminicola]|nr:hypothetical protein CKF43_06560 [Pantoea sp. ARC607]
MSILFFHQRLTINYFMQRVFYLLPDVQLISQASAWRGDAHDKPISARLQTSGHIASQPVT